MSCHHDQDHLFCRQYRCDRSASQRPHSMWDFLLMGFSACDLLSLLRGEHSALLREGGRNGGSEWQRDRDSATERDHRRLSSWQLVCLCFHWSPPGFSCLSLAAPYQGPLVHCSCFAGHRAELMPRGIEKISASKPSMDRLERESLLRRTQQAPYGQKSSSLELSGGPILIKPWPVGNCPDIKPRLSDMSQGTV